MKISDIQSETRITDFENFFSIYEDSRKNYSYNLNETIYFDVDNSQLKVFTLDTDAFWTLISYKLYHTTRLAWLLMKINKVSAKNMFDKKKAGDKILYLSKETVEKIVTQF